MNLLLDLVQMMGQIFVVDTRGFHQKAQRIFGLNVLFGPSHQLIEARLFVGKTLYLGEVEISRGIPQAQTSREGILGDVDADTLGTIHFLRIELRLRPLTRSPSSILLFYPGSIRSALSTVQTLENGACAGHSSPTVWTNLPSENLPCTQGQIPLDSRQGNDP